METTEQKKARGFAVMAAEQVRAIASKGGKAAHRMGLAHEYTSETASKAGRKGGEANAAVPGRMAEIGRKGGIASGQSRAERAEASAAEVTTMTMYQSARDPLIRYRIGDAGQVEMRCGAGAWTPTSITEKQIEEAVENGNLRTITQ